MAGVLTSIGLAGCATIQNAGTLSFSAQVLQQQSVDAPARVSARLENVGVIPMEVKFGPALLFTDNAADYLEWSETMVIEPGSKVGFSDNPEQTADGCWRFPDDGIIGIQSILESRLVTPGESISEEYEVYTRGEETPCLPEGTYRFQDQGYVGSRDNPFVWTLELIIDEDGELRAKAKGPDDPPGGP